MPRTKAQPVRPPAPRAVRALPSPEPTLASTVLDRLREDIVYGRIAPGEKLRLEHLAVQYEVGRTPLREACCRLASEGLITILDQRGFRAAPISWTDLVDLVRTRQQIEPLALRSSMAHGDLAWEGEVTAALHRLLRLSPKQNARTRSKISLDHTWEREHRRFHDALLGACESSWLLRFHGILFEQSERYRRLAIGYGQPERDIDGEHEALANAALNRDTERACALLVEHIAKTSDRVFAGHAGLQTEAASQGRAFLSTK